VHVQSEELDFPMYDQLSYLLQVALLTFPIRTRKRFYYSIYFDHGRTNASPGITSETGSEDRQRSLPGLST
jgi:hypothetical protein